MMKYVIGVAAALALASCGGPAQAAPKHPVHHGDYGKDYDRGRGGDYQGYSKADAYWLDQHMRKHGKHGH